MNEFERRALEWLQAMRESLGNPHAVSVALGFKGNWAGRILDGTKRCNWDFDTLAKIARNLGVTPEQLDRAIEGRLALPAKPKEAIPRAKPRRVTRQRPARKIVPIGTN